MSKFYIGVDLGGTNIKLAVIDSKVKIIEEALIDTKISASPEIVIDEIISAVKKFKNYKNVESIGVGIAGDIDFEGGIVRFSPNLPKWHNVKLKSIMERKSGKKIFVDNDANTASLGAFWLDAKGKPENLVCLTLGTGVGCGLIFNKLLYRGATGTAGEAGHVTIDYNGPKCNCGNRGCIETYIGAKYLTKQAHKAYAKKMSAQVSKLTGGNSKNITPKILSAAAKSGDKTAKAIWQDAGQKLGIAMAGIINLLNPSVIVLCGGISLAGKLITVPAKAEIKKRAFKTAASVCKIVVSEYSNKLGVVGAAMLAQM
jgi:glucokinase